MENRETTLPNQPEHRTEVALDTWKEIAAYLQRDVRTVIRWEKREGLPIHRHLHKSGSSVYAFRSELDVWRANRVPAGEGFRYGNLWWPRALRVACGSALLVLLLFSTGNGGRAHSSATSVAAADGSKISTRVVWHDAMDGIFGSPSPDGKNLSFLDWMTCNLAVWDFESETQRLLTREGSWDEPEEMAYSSIWSPDGKFLAFEWVVLREGERDNEVRVISRDGSDSRVILQGIEANAIAVRDWSPDGKQILVQINEDGASPSQKINQLALARVKDGVLDILASGEAFSGATFSQDGRYILYSRPPEGEKFEADVFLLDIQTRTETCLVRHPAHDTVVGWVPDTDCVLFVSDRTGSNGLWCLTVKDGRSEGTPVLLKRDVGWIGPLGFSRDGAFFYSVLKAARDIFTIEIDPETGNVVRQPEKTILKNEGLNQSPSYSPDGRYLAYLTKRGGVYPGTNVGNALCVRSIATNQESIFFKEFRELGLRYIRGPRWYPNNEAIMIAGWGERAGFYRVDLDDQSVDQVLEFPEDVGPQGHELAPDGDTLYYSYRGPKGAGAIVRRQLSTGLERELAKTGASISLSPDGQLLAFSYGDENEKTLQVMPSSGGEARVLHRFEPKGYGVSHAWSPDGKYIFFTGKDRVGNERSLCRISVEEGVVQELTPKMLSLGAITVHPDGRRIAFHIASEIDSATDVWVMKDYLPE